MRTTRPPVDVERELAVEQDLDATAGAGRPRRRPLRALERRLGPGPGDAVAVEPRPLLEGHHGEAGLLAGLAVDARARQEAEVGQPVLQRARRRQSGPSRTGGGGSSGAGTSSSRTSAAVIGNFVA